MKIQILKDTRKNSDASSSWLTLSKLTEQKHEVDCKVKNLFPVDKQREHPDS
jgi:hypothetical protein